jgi:hypothetical protein
MAYLRLVLSDAELKAFKEAAGKAHLPTASWARSSLIGLAKSGEKPAHVPIAEVRAAERYTKLRKHMADPDYMFYPETMEQWEARRNRDTLASASERAHTVKMMALYRAEQEV